MRNVLPEGFVLLLELVQLVDGEPDRDHGEQGDANRRSQCLTSAFPSLPSTHRQIVPAAGSRLALSLDGDRLPQTCHQTFELVWIQHNLNGVLLVLEDHSRDGSGTSVAVTLAAAVSSLHVHDIQLIVAEMFFMVIQKL